MSKRRIFVLLLFCCLIGGSYFLMRVPDSLEKSCAFCDPDVLNRQKFYEDDLVLALYTHKPILPGHCLVIPKRHVERFEHLTDLEFMQIGIVLKKVDGAVKKVFGTAASLLLQKNGNEVGQTVPHVHFHYIPRQAGDSSTLLFLANMYLANFKGPIAPGQMEEIVEKLQSAINSN